MPAAPPFTPTTTRDRLLAKATPQGTLTHTYDAIGNVLSIRSSNANGASTTYGYDVLNRLATVTDASGTTNYTYDQAGNQGTVVYPNGVQHSLTHDSLDRITNLAATQASPLASFAYTLGLTGHRLSVSELSGRQVNYSYDSVFKLTGETIVNTGLINYTYDAVGNRLSRTSTVPAVPAATYAYDANDRLAADSYDANGNTITSGGNTLVYDFENRLKAMNGGAVSITYDGDGNRVSKTVGGVTTKYLVDDHNPTGYSQVVDEIVNGAVQRIYTYGAARINQRQLLNGVWTTHFYGYDAQGTVRYLTNSTGTVSDSYTYDAFGNVIGTVGSTPNAYLYVGEQFDSDLGLYYLRARYYRKTWLGLYITRAESRVAPARVEVVTRREDSLTIYRIITNPPNAELLFSEVPAVSAGAAVTVGGRVDLREQEHEAVFRLGKHVYRVRLESAQPDLCDAVITLRDGGRTQKLFDARPSDELACDELHFRIHWAGDLDRDGRLDMLVTFSRKYSYFPRQLLLSSAAGPGDLVSEAGRYERFSQ